MNTDRELLLAALDKAKQLEGHIEQSAAHMNRISDENRLLTRQLREVRRMASEQDANCDKAEMPQAMTGTAREVFRCPNCGYKH